MKKIFTSDSFFMVSMILAAMCESVYCIFGLLGVYGSSLAYVQLLIQTVCVFFLYISYRDHQKNVMKGMMGALLMAQVSTALSFFTSDMELVNIFATGIFALLALILLITHLIINGDRRANPSMVRLNQIFVVLYALANVLRCLPACVDEVSTVMNIIGILGCFGISSVIVCVESRLDAYRTDREKAGWTEETGYPEGYVHPYEKDRK